jgi:toxin ParE1/3/4
MAYEITEPAERDIEGILRETLKGFGIRQLGVYEQIIEKGLAMVGEDPGWPGSIDRSEAQPRIASITRPAGCRTV